MTTGYTRVSSLGSLIISRNSYRLLGILRIVPRLSSPKPHNPLSKERAKCHASYSCPTGSYCILLASCRRGCASCSCYTALSRQLVARPLARVPFRPTVSTRFSQLSSLSRACKGAFMSPKGVATKSRESLESLRSP